MGLHNAVAQVSSARCISTHAIAANVDPIYQTVLDTSVACISPGIQGRKMTAEKRTVVAAYTVREETARRGEHPRPVQPRGNAELCWSSRVGSMMLVGG